MLSFPEPPYAWPACTVVWEVGLVRVLPTRSKQINFYNFYDKNEIQSSSFRSQRRRHI